MITKSIKHLLGAGCLCCGVAAALTSCTEDYTDWATPQANTASEAAQKLVMTLQPTVSSTIDLATYTGETIQLFSTNLTKQEAEEYEVTLAGDDPNVVMKLTADAEGYIRTEDLKESLEQLFGRAPVERTLSVLVSTVATNSTADGNVSVRREASPFTIKAKLDAPFIDPNGYYYVGAVTTDKLYKLSNGGGDVYADPVFTGVIPAYDGDWHWFKIAPDCTFNADGTFNWDNEEKYCIGPSVKDDEATSGSTSIGKLSWHLIQSADYVAYRVTINALEGTYKIEGISAIPEYYAVGTVTSWNAGERVCAMFPTSGNTITLTSYFTGAWDMRMWPAENFGNWDHGKAIGTAVNGDTASEGKLCWNTDNDGNLASPEAGYYTLDCDLGNMTYKWTKYEGEIATYEKIGLVGGNDDWDNDIFLTQVQSNNSDGQPTHVWYALGVTIESCTWGVKFRANASWSVKDWGKGDQGFPYAQSNSGDNIPFEPGTYDVYFNDLTGHYFFVAK